jgi:hypothetical protein
MVTDRKMKPWLKMLVGSSPDSGNYEDETGQGKIKTGVV